MRLIIQLDLMETCNTSVMPDDFISQLAANIKAKEESAALASKTQLHKADFIRANCHAFFEQVVGELKRLTDDLTQALEGTSSAEPPIVLSRPGNVANPGVMVAKDDFPSANAKLNLNPQGLNLAFHLTWAARKNGPTPHAILGAWKFDVSPENNLILTKQPGGAAQSFSTPKELAEFVIKTIFTV